MPETNNFSSNFAEIAKKYGPAAIVASLLLGGANTYLAAKTKPANETAKQRRRRLLRSFLLPSLTAAGGVAALGAAKALYDTPSIDSKATIETNKALGAIVKEHKESKKAPPGGVTGFFVEKGNDWAVPVVGGTIGGAVGARVGGKLSDAVKAAEPVVRAVTRGILGIPIKALSKTRKFRGIARLLNKINPGKTPIKPETIDTYARPVLMAVPGLSGATTGGIVGVKVRDAGRSVLDKIVDFSGNIPITQEELNQFKLRNQ